MATTIPFPSRASSVLERVGAYTALQASAAQMEQAIADASTPQEAELFWTWALAMENVLNRLVVQAGEKLNALAAKENAWTAHSHPCFHCGVQVPCRDDEDPCCDGLRSNNPNYLCARCEDERDQARRDEARR